MKLQTSIWWWRLELFVGLFQKSCTLNFWWNYSMTPYSYNLHLEPQKVKVCYMLTFKVSMCTLWKHNCMLWGFISMCILFMEANLNALYHACNVFRRDFGKCEVLWSCGLFHDKVWHDIYLREIVYMWKTCYYFIYSINIFQVWKWLIYFVCQVICGV